MWRRVRWVVVLVVLVLAGAALAGALLVRPDLEDARDRVDARWAALRPALIERYAALDVIVEALEAAEAGDRTVVRDLNRELSRWGQLSASSDAGDQATSANALEALNRRMRANVFASDRLSSNQAVRDAINAFLQEVVPPPAIEAYNRAVRRYESVRDGTFERIVAGVLDFSPRPTLLIG